MKLTILGAGPGGYVSAIRAAQQGCDVTIIERNGLGGVCLQHGCIPVKSLLISARVYGQAMNAEAFGVLCGDVRFDYSRMVKRKDDIVSLNEKGIETLLQKHKVKLVRGSGRLLSPSEIEVTGVNGEENRIESDAVIIATGSSSVIPDFIPRDSKKIFDCEGALALTELPESCVILGGGILGCEFASLFSDLGVRVTIIEMLDTLMPTFDTDLSTALIRSFKRRKIDVRTGRAVKIVHAGEGEDAVNVDLDTGDMIEAASCLVALGRKPNTDNIGLEEAGVALWEEKYKGIRVDEFMRTNVKGVYAVGDVNGIRPLAHIASAQGGTAVDHICGVENPMQYDAVPDCFWANPEIASVGITEQEAKKRGIEVDIAKFYYRSLAISHALGAIDGFVKAIAEKGTGKVIGVHICGHGAPDLIAEPSVIVANGLTVDDVEHTIHAHPTLGEIVKEGIVATEGKNIHG